MSYTDLVVNIRWTGVFPVNRHGPLQRTGHSLTEGKCRRQLSDDMATKA